MLLPHQELLPIHQWRQPLPLWEKLEHRRHTLSEQLMNRKLDLMVPSKVPNQSRRKARLRRPKQLGTHSSLVSRGIAQPKYVMHQVPIQPPHRPLTFSEVTMTTHYPAEMKTRWVRLVRLPRDEAMPRLTPRLLLKLASQPLLPYREPVSYQLPNSLNSGWLRWMNFVRQSRVSLR